MPTAERNQVKRQQIMDHAKILFARFGYKKTTLDDIAKSMNVVKGTLYYYFPDKESLFSEIVKLETEQAIMRLEEAISGAPSAKQKFVNYIKTRALIIRDIAKKTNTTKEAFYEIHSILFSMATSYYPREQKIIAQILAEGAREGSFRKIEVGIAAEVISDSLRSQEVSWISDEESVLRKKIRATWNLFLRGIEVEHEAE